MFKKLITAGEIEGKFMLNSAIQKTINGILRVALLMFFYPSYSFDKILSDHSHGKIKILLGIETAVISILSLIYLIIKGFLSLSLSKIFAGLFTAIVSSVFIFAGVFFIWQIVSIFFSRVGRYLLKGKGSDEDLLSVVGLFLIASFLLFVPICFFESIFLKGIAPISKILSPPFTIFYLTIALKRAHKFNTLKALFLFFSLFIFLIIIGVPLLLLFETLKFPWR